MANGGPHLVASCFKSSPSIGHTLLKLGSRGAVWEIGHQAKLQEFLLLDQKGSGLALACRPSVFSGVGASRPPGGGSLWGPGLGSLYALVKLVRACASSPKISWGGHKILRICFCLGMLGGDC